MKKRDNTIIKDVSKSRVTNTLINTAYGVFVKIITLVLNFATRTVFIRYLGIEYTGVSAVFTDILTVLSFAELGIGSAITFSLYKPIENRDYKKIAALLNLFKNAYRVISCAIFVIGISLVPFLDKLITNVPEVKENLTLIYLLYIFNTAVSYLLIYKSTLLTASQQAYFISAVNLCVMVVRFILQIAVVVLFRQFILFLIIAIVSTIIQNLIISFKASERFKDIKQYKNEKISKDERKRIFKDVKALSLYKISGTVLNGTNSIVISSVLGANIVGIVSNYTLIITEIYSFALQFLNSVTASIGNLVVSKNSERQYEMFRIMNFACEWFFCVCTVCLYNLLDEFIGNVWLGNEFIISKWAVILICVDFYIKGNMTLIGSFRNANGLFVQGQYRPLIMAILNIVIAIIGAKTFGIAGVFLGTVLARATTQLWFDPFIIYKHAFKKSVKGYFGEYAVWLFILVFCSLTAKLLNSFIVINIPIISFVVHALVCVVLVCLMTFVIFGKNKVFHNSLTYAINIVKKKKVRN
jgi:O-antigen/teichoic acid export membrane protein